MIKKVFLKELWFDTRAVRPNSPRTAYILFALLFIITYSHAATTVYGNSTTTPFGFNSPIVAKTYDPSTGTFYVGIENQTNFPSGTFSLAKALRPSPSNIGQFVGIGTDSILTDQTLEFLTTIPGQNNARAFNPIMLGMVILNGTPFTQTFVTASTNDGRSVLSSDAFNDANSVAPNTTSGIVNVAANHCFILPALRPNGANFGALNSGIGLANVQGNPLTLRILDAATGLPGNLAIPFDSTITELKGDGGGNDVIFSSTTDDVNEVAMYFDEILNRFYIGVRIRTGAAATDIGKSVVVASVDEDDGNRIELFPIVADSAIDSTENETIVAEGANKNLRALHIRAMHCSTGPDYLIINGSEGLTTQVSNEIHALPLVNDFENEEVHGTLADANSDLSIDEHTFTVPATAPGDLLANDDVRSLVGTGPLPIQPDQSISDMVVVGDAVYVSIDIAPDCDADPGVSNDTGIFYSQALFDASGKIARWTPWKRATPFDAFVDVRLDGCLSHDGQVKFFNVDAKTGSFWIVEGTTDRFVGSTGWSRGASQNGLLSQLNDLLKSGSTSVLDLNQQTRGFDNATADRYALFGGVNKVVVARVSQACDIDNPLSPETVFTDFNSDENIFIDELPDLENTECPMGAGCVTVLEYSRRTEDEGDQNYFFAGTESGLYAFSVGGNGFNVNTLTTLDEPPFIGGNWERIDGIDGAIIDIKTSGAKLYVLTLNHSDEQPFINTLYSIDYANTLNTMFDEANIDTIAQNSVGVFEDTSAFFAIAIISTGDVDNDPQKEQLILATSTGLYKSNADQTAAARGIIEATDQALALWELVDGTANTLFNGIGFIDTPISDTIWPISVADAFNHKTFDRSDINQLSGSGNDTGTAAEIGTFEPEFFNALSANKKFNTLYPITYFWSDGGRRFFIINRTTSGAQSTQLAVMPFGVNEWSVQQFEPLFNPTLRQFRGINWVRDIGATGLVIAGTNRGVVGLE